MLFRDKSYTIFSLQGAAIIHMLEDTVGEKTIRNALTYYLNKHKFANAVTNDLWSAISKQWDLTRISSSSHYATSNFTVQEMMDTWTLQMGYPIVTFDQHNDTNIYTIRQERFFRAASVVNVSEIDERKEEQTGYSWVLPLSYHTNLNLRDYGQKFYILNRTQSKSLLQQHLNSKRRFFLFQQLTSSFRAMPSGSRPTSTEPDSTA
jgi:aminopeptidase N